MAVGESFPVGARAAVKIRSVLNGPFTTETLVRGVSETERLFKQRVSEIATLAKAMEFCRDGTAFTAMSTRVAAIDD